MFRWTLQVLWMSILTVHGTHLPFISVDDYSALMNSVLNGYSKKIRPVLDQSKAVYMYVSLWISSINDVIAHEQKMVTTAYLQVTWVDEMITWNSTKWGINKMFFNQVLQHYFQTSFCCNVYTVFKV
jgi:hypothetical protein